MSNETKVITDTVTICSNMWETGRITAEFESHRYPELPELLDTLVSMEISPFSIIWKDRVKLVKEIDLIISKYSI